MLIDCSHTIEHGMVTYRGLPAPLICDFLSREEFAAWRDAGKLLEWAEVYGTPYGTPFEDVAQARRVA